MRATVGTSLVLGGGGFLDQVLATEVLVPGSESLPNGAALDTVLRRPFQQIVVTTPLETKTSDWVIERIDGPRWVVVRTPGDTADDFDLARLREDHAVARGAVVVATTTCFGRALDATISPMIRAITRLRVCPVPMFATATVQPLHVDDLISLLTAVRSSPRSGRFSAGGAEAVTVSELLGTIAEIVGARPLYIRAGGERLQHLLATALSAPLFRACETVDMTDTSHTFGWSPEPLGVRLEQAVREIAH